MTVICGALLKKCLELLERGIHATVVSDAFAKAAQKAIEVSSLDLQGSFHSALNLILVGLERLADVDCYLQVLQDMSAPVDLDDREALLKAATT